MRIAKLKSVLIFSVFCFVSLGAKAQFMSYKDRVFNHLDLGITAGTTGIGVEVASPLGQYLRVRTGVDYMPHFSYMMNFGIRLGDDPQGKYDENGNLTQFGKLAGLLKDMTGYEPDDHATMEGHPTFTNYKFLVDVLPFQNKKWRFTVGFYAGGSRVAEAENVIEDASTLFAVSLYNNLYEKVKNEEEIFMGAEFPPEISEKILSYGTMGMILGSYSHDITDKEGNILHKKGEPYKMFPNEKNMVESYIKANKVRPYIGFGYGGPLRRNEKIDCSFDLGAMYLGDVHVYTHDGTCLSHDVHHYGSSIKDYMNFFNNVKVYPVLNFRISYRLF